MKRAFLFLAAMFLADRVIGFGLSRLYRHCLTGENGGLTNYALQQDADVLVLGSSRAQHHVVPSILSRRLGLKVYNAGIDGQDFLYAVMLFNLWTSIHGAPKVVVLEVDPLSFQRSKEELQRESIFAPFSDRNAAIRQILMLRGPFEGLKLFSHAYRYNGKVLAIVKNLFVRPAPSFDGYVGIAPGKLTDNGSRPIAIPIPLPNQRTAFWDSKVVLFDRLCAFCRAHGTQLFLVHSPHYDEDPSVERDWRIQLASLLARHPAAEFIDGDALFARFSNRPELFSDSIHLNDRGAHLFSTLLANDLARRLAQPKSTLPPGGVTARKL